MENASKALLIAGAVLIVILLIGIGMLIYSRSTGVVDTAASTMNTQEIQAFNSQFTPYEGEQQGSTVRAMLATIIANNGTYATQTSKIVSVTLTSEIGKAAGTYKDFSDLSEISKAIETPTTYKVTFTGYNNNGLVNAITISK